MSLDFVNRVKEQAELAAELPVADDITVEADSGGHRRVSSSFAAGEGAFSH